MKRAGDEGGSKLVATGVRAVPLLVSLHMPKTAGSSFAEALRGYYGSRYRACYDAMPMQVSPLQRRWAALGGAWRLLQTGADGAVDCVHGHFLPIKYRLGMGRRRPLHFITWLRDPVERVVSHYHYWRRNYAGDDPRQPLRNRMLEEGWSLERFALGPEMRNVYREYLWCFDPGRFDFIGITEHYEADLARLSQRLFAKDVLGASATLVNPDRQDDRYAIGEGLRHRIEDHHAADVDLYRWALRRRTTFS